MKAIVIFIFDLSLMAGCLVLAKEPLERVYSPRKVTPASSCDLSESAMLNLLGYSKQLSGKTYCLKSSRPSYECSDVTWEQGICLTSRRPSYECSGVSLPTAVCLTSERPTFECAEVTLNQATCLSRGRPSFECEGVDSCSAICLSGGRPSFECSGLTSIDQAVCLSNPRRQSFECSE